MKKFFGILLLIVVTATASVHLTKNWDTVKSWFTPTEQVQGPPTETDVNQMEVKNSGNY